MSINAQVHVCMCVWDTPTIVWTNSMYMYCVVCMSVLYIYMCTHTCVCMWAQIYNYMYWQTQNTYIFTTHHIHVHVHVPCPLELGTHKLPQDNQWAIIHSSCPHSALPCLNSTATCTLFKLDLLYKAVPLAGCVSSANHHPVMPTQLHCTMLIAQCYRDTNHCSACVCVCV